MKKTVISLIILATVGSVHARNDGDGPSNNNGPTFGGTTTVNANPSAGAVAGASAHSQATGVGIGVGIGGQGGAGGNASATANGGTGIGLGGNANATGGNASNRTDVTTSVRNDVAQGQNQGQLQGQQQQAISGGNKLTNEGNNAAQSTSVTVEGDTYQAARIPVATAYAAPLAASNGTCMGSTSVGGQGVTIGLSVGTTWTDSSCDLRYDAEALRAAGQPAAAVARLCQKPEIAAAMEAAGTKCPGKSKTAAAPASTSTAPAVATSQYIGSDPIVMQRLGIAPLAAR